MLFLLEALFTFGVLVLFALGLCVIYFLVILFISKILDV